MKNLLLILTVSFCFVVAAFGAAPADGGKILLQAEEARVDGNRAVIAEQAAFKSGRGVSLKPGVETMVESPDAPPDLTFTVSAEQSGRFVIRSYAAVNDDGAAVMAKAKTKYESLFMRIAVGKARASKRVVFVPWSKPEGSLQETGKFDLTSQEQEIRVWLPRGVQLDYLEIFPYVPPKVPQAVAEYRPTVAPPDSHPRLWVNAESLPKVRANLNKGENADAWKKVQVAAGKPFEFKADPDTAVDYNAELETAALNKAFVYLMTGDKDMGREAVSLTRDYLQAVEFGNILDITREIGRAIYTGARVYDWCFDLMSEDDRQIMRQNMMRLADDMEMGWPPFKQSVVNGHGSEAQLLCHLLSMSIAIYDEDPVPYQYCANRILNELVPMRNFEYQSPRHNQGISYGIYRFGWDMHAAWLFYRMTGHKVFDSNIEDMYKYWLYTRLPGVTTMGDGDGTAYNSPKPLGALALLMGAYSNNPIMKYDFKRQGGLPSDPILVLLLNDPDLKSADGLSSLPLTLDFGPILGGMVARTGWDMDKSTSDVVVMMTGGGYNFGNHQHVDAGSFQVYFHGVQVADLGEYGFYGTPYDMNFNKRSIAHSMMLALDPNEKFGGGKLLNDGGARFEHSSPTSPEMVKKDQKYANGKIVSSSFGPSASTPEFSYFSVDLTSAYSKKVANYVRTFCFLNLEDKEVPAALIVVDHMETSGPEVEKYWQVNTLKPPMVTSNSIVLTGGGAPDKGKVFVQMLRPSTEDTDVKVLSGVDAASVFGHHLITPHPDALQTKGHRILVSPKGKEKTDTFVTVMTMAGAGVTTVPVSLTETNDVFVVSLADRIVALSQTGELITGRFTVDVRADELTRVVLTGLQPGTWSIKNSAGQFHMDVMVIAGKNTKSVKLPKGTYEIDMKR